MGFISNQWLNRGQGLRNRKYNPVPVSVTCFRPLDSWSSNRGIQAEFTARNDDGEIQTLHLSQAEVDAAAQELVASMSAKAREQLLVQTLRGLSHAKLLRVLAFDLRARVKLPKQA